MISFTKQNLSISAYRQAIEGYGFSVIEGVFEKHRVFSVTDSLKFAIGKDYGLRRLLEVVPAVRQLCWEASIRNLVEPILGEKAFPVRGIFFDKNPQANWGVPWHQDVTIAVKQRIDTSGFTPWTIKDGVHHVQPPIPILERMLTLRIHLDDTPTDNAPLQVIPGSHRHGLLKPETIESLKGSAVSCLVPCGGVLAMKPLLVHSSRPAQKPTHRRVIHIEFAAEELPGGLEWYGS